VSDPEVYLKKVSSKTEALSIVGTKWPHLVIADSASPDFDWRDLVSETILSDAMVNTAVMSALSDHEFHEAAEGLGILCRLPLDPGPAEADGLLKKLRNVML
jgi:hypothetical protein